jgi:hypothetical protein
MMYPVFASADPLGRGAETPYGPAGAPEPAAARFEPAPLGVIAAGRLELVRGEASGAGPAAVDHEVYRLYWLPWEYGVERSDWSEIALEPPIGAPGVRRIEAGMVVWLPSEATRAPTIAYDAEAGEYDEIEVVAFNVLAAPFAALGGEAAHQALVARADGVPVRRLSAS